MSAYKDPGILAIRLQDVERRLDRIEKKELEELQARGQQERRSAENWKLALKGLLVVQTIVTLVILFGPRP